MSAAAQMPKVEPLVRTKFCLAEHGFRRFNALVDSDVRRDELEDPRFWEHVHQQLREFDEVRVVAEDGSFVANLLVVAKVSNCAYMRVIWGLDLEPPAVNAATASQDRYEVKYRGNAKWCVVDSSTGECLKTGLPSKSKAQRELEEYLLAISR